MRFAEKCKALSDSVNKKSKFYEKLKDEIEERANRGYYWYSFTLKSPITDTLEKLLKEEGFDIDVQNVYDCGHFMYSNFRINWSRA